MRRATTPTHYFNFPIDPNIISKILLTYSQNDEIVLNKTEADFTFNGTTGMVTLTQEETNLFSDECVMPNKQVIVEVQLRVLTDSGKALASDVWKVPLKKILNDEVLRL